MTETLPLPLLAAEAYAALERSGGHCRALESALQQASNALASSGLEDLERQAGKIIELHRLIAVRVELLAKRVAEGGT